MKKRNKAHFKLKQVTTPTTNLNSSGSSGSKEMPPEVKRMLEAVVKLGINAIIADIMWKEVFKHDKKLRLIIGGPNRKTARKRTKKRS
jgi:hypothetical protein